MESKITDVRAKLYTWKGPIQKIHDNFCTSAADLLNKENISSDGMATFKFWSLTKYIMKKMSNGPKSAINLIIGLFIKKC